MKKYITPLILLLAICFLPLSAQNTKIEHISSTVFQKLIEKQEGTLQDVRTETEFANGHLPKAVQLNYYALDFNKKHLLLPKDEPIFLYCNTGWRSRRAAETLVKNNYTQVYILKHGIMEWELFDLPVIVEPNARPDQKDKMEIEEFQELINSDELVLIDFYPPWCGPCRQMMPMVDSLQIEFTGKAAVVKINTDASKKLVRSLQLGSVPYFELYKNGNKIFDHSGIIDRKEIIQVLSSNQ